MNYFEMKWRLSACRIQAGYSQAEVAEILGCSDKTIVSWETGKTAPKMEKAQELRRLSLLPIININTSKDKVTRAMRRSANFENHKVYFREGMDDLEECLLLFPEVDHDDLFDALDFAMTMADGGNEIRVLKREDFRI